MTVSIKDLAPRGEVLESNELTKIVENTPVPQQLNPELADSGGNMSDLRTPSMVTTALSEMLDSSPVVHGTAYPTV